MDTDAIVIGGGLAGLVATAELADAGRKVILLDQEPEASLGGQAFWSLGGLMFVDSPEQRRLRIKDSRELAWQDWLGTAGFDRAEDEWPRRWAEAYVDFTAGEKREWLAGMGMKFMPNVGWAERGGYLATGHGNSVPRFHLTWGTGPGVLEPFERRVREAAARGLVELRFRHKVDELVVSGGAVSGVRGEVLEPSHVRRGEPSSRTAVGEFSLEAPVVFVTSGGIGANHELVRRNWPERLGTPPRSMITGVPDHVDGRMIQIAQDAGGNVINPDRMWHYVEGMRNWDPIWTNHGIRIIPGPSSLWFDAVGRRLPAAAVPRLRHARDARAHHGHGPRPHLVRADPEDHREGVRALGLRAEPGHHRARPQARAQGPARLRRARAGRGVHAARRRLRRRARAVRARARDERADRGAAARPRRARGRDRRPRPRDRQPVHARTSRSPRSTAPGASSPTACRASPRRTASSTRRPGPLIAVKLHILTRKTLGGLQTDLDGRVLQASGEPLPGLYAAGEVAGFGGGGMHGYRALEGTFLGGCLFSGRTAGRAAARALA